MKKMVKRTVQVCCLFALATTYSFAQQTTTEPKVVEVTPTVRLNETATGRVEGVVVMDGEMKKNKYYSANGDDSNVSFKDGVVTIAIPSKRIGEESKQLKILDERDATTVGELMFEKTDKAWVLPSAEKIKYSTKNPPAGTMVFDSKRKLLCVFNGEEWIYWSAE